MATSQIYLLQPVENLGHEGDLVTVKAGYARNYLLPRKLAIPYQRGNQKYIEALQRRKDERLKKEREYAEGLLSRLEKAQIAISVKTGDAGRLFGSVSAADLVKRLAEDGIEVDRKQLNLHTPVKSLGKHVTKIKLHPEITFELEWEVVSENPIEPTGEAEDEEEASEFVGDQ